jgi:hypothetical protein
VVSIGPLLKWLEVGGVGEGNLWMEKASREYVCDAMVLSDKLLDHHDVGPFQIQSSITKNGMQIQ